MLSGCEDHRAGLLCRPCAGRPMPKPPGTAQLKGEPAASVRPRAGPAQGGHSAVRLTSPRATALEPGDAKHIFARAATTNELYYTRLRPSSTLYDKAATMKWSPNFLCYDHQVNPVRVGSY